MQYNNQIYSKNEIEKNDNLIIFCGVGGGELYRADNFLDKNMAIKLRNFINNIPFDHTLQEINDTYNQPSNNVYNELLLHKTKNVDEKLPVIDEYNYNKWGWEHYSKYMWRLKPL